MKKIIFGLFILVAGCSANTPRLCQSWIDTGEITSSYEHCMQCVKSYGSKDLRAVRECAFKKDIATLGDGF